jgi:hypothetical protein
VGSASRRPALKHMGVDEIWLGKRTTFLTIVSNLERGQRQRIVAACVDMWQAFTNSIHEWAPRCRII